MQKKWMAIPILFLIAIVLTAAVITTDNIISTAKAASTPSPGVTIHNLISTDTTSQHFGSKCHIRKDNSIWCEYEWFEKAVTEELMKLPPVIPSTDKDCWVEELYTDGSKLRYRCPKKRGVDRTKNVDFWRSELEPKITRPGPSLGEDFHGKESW